MKISKLFHWLYFIVMMLPIFSIPIFAIYSHRHTIDSYSVTREEPYIANAYQCVINGKPNNLDNIEERGDGELSIDYTYLKDTNNDGVLMLCFYSNISVNVNDVVYIGFDYGSDDYVVDFLSLDFERSSDGFTENVNEITDLLDGFSAYSFTYTCENDIVYDNIIFNCLFDDLYIRNLVIFNLTSIFGSGNEPTADVFKDYLVLDYYNFGYNSLAVGTHNVTYNDTDIGSQFTYQVYNVVDKYFNYDNVFNFGALYDWLQLTFFNGCASLGFFIFWHLLIYWLLTSILWLVFDVLIYVPQLVHRWLDKASIS